MPTDDPYNGPIAQYHTIYASGIQTGDVVSHLGAAPVTVVYRGSTIRVRLADGRTFALERGDVVTVQR